MVEEKKVWKVLAKDHGDPAPHGVAYCYASTNDLKPLIGLNQRDWVFELRNQSWFWCGNLEDYARICKKTLAMLEDESFFEKTRGESRRTINALRDYSFALRDADARAFSNDALARAYEKLFFLWRMASAWGNVVNAADFEHFALTNRIMSFLGERIKQSGSSAASVPEAFATLTTPVEKNPLALQDEAFFLILSKIQADAKANALFSTQPTQTISKKIGEFPEIAGAVRAHSREYDWLQYHYSGPIILDEVYFIEALASEARQRVNAKNKLAELVEKTRTLREKQARLANELQLSENERYWMRLAAEFMFLKALRKDVVFQASRNTDALFTEISRRLGVTPIQARYLTPMEACEALRAGKHFDSALLAQRMAHSVWLFEEGGTVSVFVGSEADTLSKQVFEEKPPENVREIKGTPASPGFARGIVRLVAEASDIPKMKQGDILVSPATNPNLVPAMKRAAAIVTDEGGITCHAAIVSRELGIPCVVGTRVATKALRDGDEVEVDATRGVVKIIKRL